MRKLHPLSRAGGTIAIAFTLSIATLPVAAHAQGLSGLYLQNQSIGRGDVWNYYYFWPDGHVCRTMPKGGFWSGTTYASVAQQAPASCGTYAIAGNTLDLRTGGSSVPLQLKRMGGSEISLSNFPTIHVPAFQNDARLSGTWTTLVINGDDYRDVSYTFMPDGRFSYDDVRVRMVGAPTQHVQGTYQLSGNTLSLTLPRGMKTLSIHPFPNDRRLSIDGTVFQPK